MRSDVQAAVQRVSVAPVRWVLDQVLTGVDLVLNEVFDRFDLWDDKGRADYSKVRGFCFYATVIVIDSVLVALLWQVRGLMRYVKDPALVTAWIAMLKVLIGAILTLTLGALAAAFGERVLMGFFNSKIALAGVKLAAGSSVDDVAANPGKATTDG